MDLFRRIYEIEAEIRGAPPDERLDVRQARSIALVDELDDWVARHEEKLRPTELLEKARGYASHQAAYFRRCFSDGEFEIDNGDVERGMRRPAMGRRNWLFTGASSGGPRLAAAFTLVTSCRRLGLPTREYLIDVLTRLEAGWPARRGLELTPLAWGRERGLLPAA
jgi:transposase